MMATGGSYMANHNSSVGARNTPLRLRAACFPVGGLVFSVASPRQNPALDVKAQPSPHRCALAQRESVPPGMFPMPPFCEA